MQLYQRPAIHDISWGASFYFLQGTSGERKVTYTSPDESTGITAVELDIASQGLYVADRITWNLQNANSIYNGTQVTPLSKSCKFFIRYM